MRSIEGEVLPIAEIRTVREISSAAKRSQGDFSTTAEGSRDMKTIEGEISLATERIIDGIYRQLGELGQLPLGNLPNIRVHADEIDFR